MSRGERELRAQLTQAARMPEGDARIALLEDLVRHADASGVPRLSFDTRMELTAAYQHGGETGKGFVTFSWCLAAYDRDPGSFDERDDSLLRWHYKWTVAALNRFPEVPLDRSYRALDDMQRRYLAGGHSLHAVHTLRCEVANHVGDLEAADEWYREWCLAPRDENSDCIACDPTNKVYHLAGRRRDEEAVAIADPVLAGQITCDVQPQSIQAAMLFPYLRTGRLDEAREAHRRGYRAIRGNRDYLDDLGTHLEFCALTGNEAYGLEILERHLGWLDRPADPMALLSGVGAAALLLRRLRERGHGGQRLRRPGFGDRPASEPEVAELEDELRGTAIRLAGRFDARNGTDFQTRMLTRKLDAEPIVDYLSLSRPWRRGSSAASPTVDKSVDTAVEAVDDEPRGAVTPPVPPVDDLSGLDLAALLDLAERRYAQGRPELAHAAWHRYDEVAAGTAVDPLLVVRRLDATGLEQALSGDLDAAEATWRTAADRYAELADEARRQHVLGRLGIALARRRQLDEGAGQDEPAGQDEGAGLVEASAAYLADHGTARLAAQALLRLATVRGAAGATEQVLAVLDRAEDALSRLEDPEDGIWLRADIASKRAMALARQGPESLPRAAELAAQAREGMWQVGYLPPYAETSLFHGKLLCALADSEEKPDDLHTTAAECFAEAARYGGHAPMLRAQALESRGALLARTERAEEAVEDLIEAVAIYTELGTPQVAYARFDLAVALANSGRMLDAAECAEEALDAVERDGDIATVVAFRSLLTSLYAGLGEKDDALRQWDALAEHFESKGSPLPPAGAGQAGQAHEAAAGLLDELDRDAEAARRFARAAEAYQRAGDPFSVVRSTRRQVLSLHWAGDSEAGLTLAEQIGKQIDELPGDDPDAVTWERAALDFNVARILAAVGSTSEAATRASAAAAGFQDAGADDDATYAQRLAEEIAADLEEPRS